MAAGDLLYDSSRLDGTQQALTLPKGIVKNGATNYHVVVQAWDDKDRETVPGHPAYAMAEQTFDYTPGATAGVTALTATLLTATSGYIDYGVQLDFTRASGAPDEFEVWRDGQVIFKVDSADAIITGTTFRIVDRENVRPQHQHTYLVRAIVNSVASTDSGTVQFTPKTNGIWLIDPIEGWRIHLLDVDAGSFDQFEVSDIKHALGSTRPTKVTQTIGGYTGDLTGRLIAHPNAAFDQLMTHFYALKARPSRTLRLVLSDLNMPVIVSNLVDRLTPSPEIERVVSFHIEQDGELPFVAPV